MPQPTQQQVHVDAALTNIATAYAQDNDAYIADKVFPAVPVQNQSDVFWKYNKGDWFRDEAQLRADATESAGTGMTLSTQSYLAAVYALHDDIGPQARANQDPAVDIETSATQMLMQKMLIKRDRIFVTKYMASGVWTNQATGAAAGTANETTTRIFWNDDANGDPIKDISDAQDAILMSTGMLPNVLVLSWLVYKALKKHPLIIDRIKYTTPTFAGTISPQLLASLFDVEKVVVSRAVYNAAAEGATDNFSFVTGKHALLAYAAPSPGLRVPTAGYLFPWRGFTGLNNMGIRMNQQPIPLKGIGAIRVEAEMAFDMQAVGLDLGFFFNSIVQ